MSLIVMGCGSSNTLWMGKEVLLSEKNGMHFLNITLNGKNAKLLVDTGASKSLLDITQAEDYGFEYILLSKDQYVGLGGLVDIYVTYECEIEEFFIPFLGSDLSGIQNYFIKDGIHIVGILGSDFLEMNRATIDFSAHKMYMK